jgi:RNA polymerase sigma factor (sigma-70 family)
VNDLLHYIRGVAPASADVPDREYLDRFARNRDESAFAALVGRYGASVWSVCRRLVDRDQDAEDAFQATFLTLARKAGSIRGRGSLPAWLHGVARRIAANLRRDARRRAAREADAAQPSRCENTDLTWQQGLAVLDEELARLPQRYRTVLIACCLDGRSRDEVAAHLGWSDGQVKGRLERARQTLRRRLERRGFDLAALLLAATVSRSGAAGLSGAPAGLVATTVAAATATAPGAISSNVRALSEGAVHAMFIQKLKVPAVLLTIALASGGLLTYRLALGAASAQVSEADKAAAAEAARAKAEREEAERKAAAIKAARAKETPTFPTPAKAADIKVDFEEASLSIRPSFLAPQQPHSIRIRGDGICEYRIEERPARGGAPRWDPAYLEHKLPLERLRRLEGLLKKTAWLSAPGHAGRADHLHPTNYVLKVKRKGQTLTVTMDGEKPEPYRSVVSFFHGIALQENLVYRLERLPGREQYAACAEIDRYVQAERGGPFAKPLYEVDLRRYAPTFRRYVRDPFDRSKEELVPALRLLGHLRLASEREHIVTLANDRDSYVRAAVAEALGALGGKESVAVLRRMLRSTSEAAWQLVRLGPLAVPTIVEVIEGASTRTSAREPGALDHQRLIRGYIDHWDKVPKPIDPRVLAAVRKSMASPRGKGPSTEYHKKLLELASRP